MDEVPGSESQEDRRLRQRWGCRHPLFAVAVTLVIAALLWFLFL